MPDVREWGLREYAPALEAMRTLRAARQRGEVGDTLLLLEHPPVVTVGVQGNEGEPAPEGLHVYRVERGGKSTYHGPGQLVGYPIVDLGPRGRDVRRFVREVEQIVIDALAEVGVPAGRREGRRGVWTGTERKIASVGIAVEGWITFHGFALNVVNDLRPFELIQPCGFDGRIMTSVSRELGRPVPVSDLVAPVRRAWDALFGAPPGAPGPVAAVASA